MVLQTPTKTAYLEAFRRCLFGHREPHLSQAEIEERLAGTAGDKGLDEALDAGEALLDDADEGMGKTKPKAKSWGLVTCNEPSAEPELPAWPAEFRQSDSPVRQRWGIYCRVSRAMPNDASTSIYDQAADVAEVMIGNDMEVAFVAYENASGRTNERKALRQALRKAAEMELAGICVYSIDRLTRHAYRGAAILQEALDRGFQFLYLPSPKAEEFRGTSLESGDDWMLALLQLIVSERYYMAIQGQTTRRRRQDLNQGFWPRDVTKSPFFQTEFVTRDDHRLIDSPAKRKRLEKEEAESAAKENRDPIPLPAQAPGAWRPTYKPGGAMVARAAVDLLRVDASQDTLSALRRLTKQPSNKQLLKELTRPSLHGRMETKSTLEWKSEHRPDLKIFNADEWDEWLRIALGLGGAISRKRAPDWLDELAQRLGYDYVTEIEPRISLQCDFCDAPMKQLRKIPRMGFMQVVFQCTKADGHADVAARKHVAKWPKGYTYWPPKAMNEDLEAIPIARCAACGKLVDAQDVVVDDSPWDGQKRRAVTCGACGCVTSSTHYIHPTERFEAMSRVKKNAWYGEPDPGVLRIGRLPTPLHQDP